MKILNTFDAETSETVTGGPVTPQPMIAPGTVPSIISIPPQIATTVCWIALGVIIGWWFSQKRSAGRSLV